MACFLVPVAEAIVTTIVEKALKSTEKKAVVKLNSADGTALEVSKTPFSAKLGWLNKLLWGGSALLAFEHVWHGEIVPFFPFLTAVKSGETGEMLAEMGIELSKVISIEVKDEDIVKRMSGRRVCKGCGMSYHIVYKKPTAEGTCDKCGESLILRDDDKPEVVLDRLKVYYEKTAPLKDYYKKTGKLVLVEGQEEVADTTALVNEALKA